MKRLEYPIRLRQSASSRRRVSNHPSPKATTWQGREFPITRERAICLIFALCCLFVSPVHGADWPQFMRVPELNGDASDEKLTMPLGLAAQVKLDDAILTSPAIVAGKVYVVDQMGTAYCIDPDKHEILWKTSPEGEMAMGSNTSSPAIANGRVYYGTTAGNFHILNAADGTVVKTLKTGWPILGSPTAANDSVYFLAMNSILYCLDLDGNKRWTWDHYGDKGPPLSDEKKRIYRYDITRRQHASNDVAVSGRRVVTGTGVDLFCLEDNGKEANLAWCSRSSLPTRWISLTDYFLPTTIAISDGFVYTGWPGSDRGGAMMRVKLADGTLADKKNDVRRGPWAVVGASAIRNGAAYFGTHIYGVSVRDFGGTKPSYWKSFNHYVPEQHTPIVSAIALSAEHCVFSSLTGELIAVSLSSKGYGPRMKPKPFKFKTPHGKPISSGPAISDGRVFFGCDDGYLYVLGQGGSLTPKTEKLTVHEPKSTVVPATGKAYAWPSPFGDPGNTNFVDDPKLLPPFRLRWACRSFGLFKQPVSASKEDVVYQTLAGLVCCIEQATGRIRWRVKMPRYGWSHAGVLCAEGRVYVPRAAGDRKTSGQFGGIYCLDAATGETVWKAFDAWGSGTGLTEVRAAPVLAKGVLAFGSSKGKPRVSKVHGWDAKTGKHLWEVEVKAAGKGLQGPVGCVLDDVMIFSCGGSRKDGSGETVAIKPETGEIIWRTSEAWSSRNHPPTARDGRVYLRGAPPDKIATCLSAKDGKLIWRAGGNPGHGVMDAIALGPDFLTMRFYGGLALKWRLSDGVLEKAGKRKHLDIGGGGHSCGAVAVTAAGLVLAPTADGLCVVDAKTGKILWRSLGMNPRACPNPCVANGRVFYAPQVNGMLYCFEPEE